MTRTHAKTLPASPAQRATLSNVTRAQLLAVVTNARFGWTFTAVLLAALSIGLLFGILSSLSGLNLSPAVSVSTALLFAGVPAQLATISIGASSIGGEFAVGTLAASLTVCPNRKRFAWAKVWSTAIVAVSIGGIAAIVAGGSALVAVAASSGSAAPELWRGWAIACAGMALGNLVLALAALSIGALTRSRMLAILIPALVIYVIPLTTGLLPTSTGVQSVLQWLPHHALESLSGGTESISPSSGGGTEALPFGIALLVLLGWLALVLPWALFGFIRADVSNRGVRFVHHLSWQTRVSPETQAPRTQFHRLVAAEFAKALSIPAFWWIAGVAVSVEIAYGAARAVWDPLDSADGDRIESLRIALGFAPSDGAMGVALLTAVLATVTITSEFQFGTASISAIAAGRRTQLTLAKIVFVLLSSATVGVIAVTAATASAIGIFAARGFSPTASGLLAAAESAAHGIVLITLLGLLTTSFAGLLRRAAPTILVTISVLIIGPALSNTAMGMARNEAGLLVALGNIATVLPGIGSLYLPAGANGVQPPLEVTGVGAWSVSPNWALATVVLWTVTGLAAWLVADSRRPVELSREP